MKIFNGGSILNWGILNEILFVVVMLLMGFALSGLNGIVYYILKDLLKRDKNEE